MFAYVPARGGSKRIPRKNVRPLGGKPLILHVLDALAKVETLSGVAVSSDDAEILSLVKDRPGVTTLGPRDAALAGDQSTFLDLTLNDAPRFAKAFKDDDMIFVTPTAALVPPSAYAQAEKLHRLNREALVMAVTAYHQPPHLALSGDPASGLKPLFPEMYSLPTKDLPSCFTDAGCFYAFRLQAMKGKTRFLDLSPVLGVALAPSVGIDVDTESDWARLEAAYAAERSR